MDLWVGGWLRVGSVDLFEIVEGGGACVCIVIDG